MVLIPLVGVILRRTRGTRRDCKDISSARRRSAGAHFGCLAPRPHALSSRRSVRLFPVARPA